MEDRPKTTKPGRKAVSRMIPSASSHSKSSKNSSLELKNKIGHQATHANPTLKDSNSKFSIKLKESNIRPYSGVSQHRRVKSDPVPSSPYSIANKSAKPPPSKKNYSIKPSPSHKRANSDSQALKNFASNSFFNTKNEEVERENLLKIVKNCFAINVPLITTADFYKLGKQLGKGTFGKVYQGIHKLSGLKVAVKAIEKSYMQDERTRKKVLQEVYIMNKIHDKNVIRLLELFESPKHLMIVLEYAGGGDLLQLLRTRGRLSEQEARPIFKQVIDAVMACHKEDIIHRDIKLDNILLNEEMTLIKLCDFGVSRIAKFGFKINEQCGTPAYLAPEIIVNEGYEPFFVDAWSMGILLYALLSATVPFKAKTIPELHKIILRGKYEFPNYFSEEVKSFISEMLNPIPNLRIKLKDMKNNLWFATSALDSSFHSKDSNTSNKHYNILSALSDYGFPNEFVENSLKNREINHATASYNLLDINLAD
jgi:serine/threonine-protein kinase NIM1